MNMRSIKRSIKRNCVKKGIVGLALCASLTFAASAPVFAGDITIHPGEYSSTAVAARFTAYQIFTGTPNDVSDPHAMTGISWGDGVNNVALVTDMQSDPDMGTAFTEVYNKWNSSGSSTKGDTAALVARFLSDNPDYVKAFSKLAAKNKAGDGTKSTFNGSDWTITGVADGYYLIIDTVDADSYESASSYILDVVGDTEINMKSTIPTIDKTVEEKKKGNISDSGDPNDFTFTLKGTVADNIDEYSTYEYAFVDTLAAGLSADKSTVKVDIDGTTVEDGYEVTLTPDDNSSVSSTQELKVSFDNLLDEATLGVDVTKESEITVTYDAELNKFATPGKTGNENSVLIEFSNDPYSTQKGKSTPSTTKTYEFSLDITKYNGSESDDTPLAGVEFMLKNDDGQYAKMEEEGGAYSIAEWVSDEGSATAMATDGSGKLNIKGLGNDTYTLHESKVPTGFDAMKDVEFTVAGTVQDGTDELESVVVTETETRDDAKVTDTEGDGKIEVALYNYESSVLPHTGGAGTTLLYLASGALGLTGAAALAASRKRKRGTASN